MSVSSQAATGREALAPACSGPLLPPRLADSARDRPVYPDVVFRRPAGPRRRRRRGPGIASHETGPWSLHHASASRHGRERRTSVGHCRFYRPAREATRWNRIIIRAAWSMPVDGCAISPNSAPAPCQDVLPRIPCLVSLSRSFFTGSQQMERS